MYVHKNFGDFKRPEDVKAMLLYTVVIPSPCNWKAFLQNMAEYITTAETLGINLILGITSGEHTSGITHYSCVLPRGYWWFNMAAESLNDELEYVKLYRIRPLLLHFYLGPFIPIYLTWLYFWTVVYGLTDYFEAGLIALAVIGILQILSCLFCHWSVHVRCLFTCSAVRIP